MNFEDQEFEQELRGALRRKEPAKGFAERVIRRAEGGGSRLRRFAPLLIAASLVTGVFGVVRYDEYRKGERAKEQLMLALRITAKTLDTVEKKLRQE
jgi:hypothetical protein